MGGVIEKRKRCLRGQRFFVGMFFGERVQRKVRLHVRERLRGGSRGS